MVKIAFMKACELFYFITVSSVALHPLDSMDLIGGGYLV